MLVIEILVDEKDPFILHSQSMVPDDLAAMLLIYCQTSNIGHTKSQNFNVSHLILQLSLKCEILSENEDVVGAAPTGDVPTTSEWSTILLPTNMCLTLEVWGQLPNIMVPANRFQVKYEIMAYHKWIFNKNEFCDKLQLKNMFIKNPISYYSVDKKLSWFIRHLSDGLYIFYINLWNFPSDIWA